MRLGILVIAFTLAAGAAPAGAQTVRIDLDLGQIQALTQDAVRSALRSYQGRGGPEQTERFSRRVKLGRDGRVSITNVAGDISVTAGTGDEVVIDAVKRVRGDRGLLGNLRIEVSERPGRVDIETKYADNNSRGAVDYTVTVPASAAVEIKSVSSDVHVNGVRGVVRTEVVSGDIVIKGTPRLEVAKTVSGDIELTDVGNDGELAAGSVSGGIQARGLKVRGLDVNTISGEMTLSDVAASRISARSISGDVELTGALARDGRYDINTHSGAVRVMLTGDTGFELNATSFSGSIQSDVASASSSTSTSTNGRDGRGRRRGPRSDGPPPPPPPAPQAPPAPPAPPAPQGGRRGFPGNRSVQSTYGDGSARLSIRTFSGDVVVSRR